MRLPRGPEPDARSLGSWGLGVLQRHPARPCLLLSTPVHPCSPRLPSFLLLLLRARLAGDKAIGEDGKDGEDAEEAGAVAGAADKGAAAAGGGGEDAEVLKQRQLRGGLEGVGGGGWRREREGAAEVMVVVVVRVGLAPGGAGGGGCKRHGQPAVLFIPMPTVINQRHRLRPFHKSQTPRCATASAGGRPPRRRRCGR